MISHTFQCVPKLGPVLEQKLWTYGIQTWDQAATAFRPDYIREPVWNTLQQQISKAQNAFNKSDWKALAEIIPAKMHWRAIPLFLGKIAYLDIETTGLSRWNDYVTSIAVNDGEHVRTFIHGQNLDEFPDYISQFSAIATFFGKSFDIPFLLYEFRRKGVTFPPFHFDVCFLLRRLGRRGGLKAIEGEFGIDRGEVEGIDGFLGVLLWKKYLISKKESYLHTLLAYNVEDVLNLEFLLRTAYNGLIQKEKMPCSPISVPEKKVENPYQVDHEVLDPLLNAKLGNFL